MHFPGFGIIFGKYAIGGYQWIAFLLCFSLYRGSGRDNCFCGNKVGGYGISILSPIKGGFFMKRVLCLSILLLCMLPAAFAQTIDGNIVGKVLDRSGAVIPNATVEIQNNATGFKLPFNRLPPGKASDRSVGRHCSDSRSILRSWRKVCPIPMS